MPLIGCGTIRLEPGQMDRTGPNRDECDRPARFAAVSRSEVGVTEPRWLYSPWATTMVPAV